MSSFWHKYAQNEEVVYGVQFAIDDQIRPDIEAIYQEAYDNGASEETLRYLSRVLDYLDDFERKTESMVSHHSYGPGPGYRRY